MRDRELLELAAKAAGLEYLEYVPESYPSRAGLLHGNPNGRLFVWNPLDDDGEALRLGACLRIDIRHWDGPDRISAEHPLLPENSIMVDVLGGPMLATRKAIVRAAAALAPAIIKPE